MERERSYCPECHALYLDMERVERHAEGCSYEGDEESSTYPMIDDRDEEGDIKEAFRVILSDTKARQRSLKYAVDYATIGLAMEGEELKVQALYVLSNIAFWRHPKANEVRKVLRKCR